MAQLWYEPHPVTPARKRELVAAGFKIVDLKHAPPGWQVPQTAAAAIHVTPPAEHATAPSAQPVNDVDPIDSEAAREAARPSANELRAKLEAAGIEYPKYARVAKLAELAAEI
jgi:hypothetical protein